MLQRDIFLQGEGKAWLERNRDKLGQHDPVSELIEAQGIKPTSVLEIGCADGWRLRKLRDRYDCICCGVDPGVTIIQEGDMLSVERGTARFLSYGGDSFDLVIFGFCLYLCDPCDYFRIVAESDRVLADGGHLVIHDFNRPADEYRVPYKHQDGVYSHHMWWERLWTSHPAYRDVGPQMGGADDTVIMLRKDLKGAFRDAQPLT